MKDRSLELTSAYREVDKKRVKMAVKVVDIFGNDTISSCSLCDIERNVSALEEIINTFAGMPFTDAEAASKSDCLVDCRDVKFRKF